MREILWRTGRTVNAVINRGNVPRMSEYLTNWAELPAPAQRPGRKGAADLRYSIRPQARTTQWRPAAARLPDMFVTIS
ncbi:hypothetical protein [Amycolatopsis jejuensis]|uniref:hypothetical protein n=1 Tax=Amycolatopsis jejuensis TaxID=330084 RepID=UPI0012E0AD29|nr:hypothetical protein [Amycolatopsis jejuensis]